MKMNEFAFAISTLHFPALGKWIKAISEVEAYGATENTSPKEGCLFWPKMQYIYYGYYINIPGSMIGTVHGYCTVKKGRFSRVG